MEEAALRIGVHNSHEPPYPFAAVKLTARGSDVFTKQNGPVVPSAAGRYPVICVWMVIPIKLALGPSQQGH
jgi:hypothetical protein